MRTCKFLGKKIGHADARCAGVFNLYQCTLLHLPCTAHNVQVDSIIFLDDSRSKDLPLNCAFCNFNTVEKSKELPRSC